MTAAEIAEKLKSLPYGHEDIQAFGYPRIYVHVTCKSKATAAKWAAILAVIFRGTPIRTIETSWPAKENKGTQLRPTRIHGFRVIVMGY